MISMREFVASKQKKVQKKLRNMCIFCAKVHGISIECPTVVVTTERRTA